MFQTTNQKWDEPPSMLHHGHLVTAGAFLALATASSSRTRSLTGHAAASAVTARASGCVAAGENNRGKMWGKTWKNVGKTWENVGKICGKWADIMIF